jgi:hypothetical protein
MVPWLRWEVWACVLAAVCFVWWLKDRRFSLRERTDWSRSAAVDRRRKETSRRSLR